MAISTDAALTRLEANLTVIRGLLAGVSPEQAGWRPAPGAWSILEVTCHLADEEVEDFRTRLDLTLHQPDTAWPTIDPQGWVTSRAYAEQDLAATLTRYSAERERTLTWLRGLAAPDWSAENVHPVFGAMSAGSLLHAWLAHDLMHIRQLTELQHHWLAERSAPYDPGYAGDW